MLKIMNVSLAYKFEAVSLKACGSYSIYIKKWIGHRIKSYGTPHVIKPSSEQIPFSNTKNFLFEI